MTGAVRALVVHVPDWPVVAARVALDQPAAAFHANRAVATSPAARAEGVAAHQRRREAQARCPSLVVLAHDPSRDARAFEPVAAALDAITPRVEVLEPGLVAFPTRGPSRFFGGDAALAERTRAVVAEVLAPVAPEGAPPPSVQVGVADGTFAACLAAEIAAASSRGGPPCAEGPVAAGGRRTPSSSPAGAHVVPPGGSAAFLAPHPVTALDRPVLVDVLQRLGVTTLGALADLPAADVLARFGAEGQEAWRLARGLDPRPLALADPPAELTVEVSLDPPADTVAPAAFLARGLAEEFHRRLWARGSACTRVLIGAETEHGERLERIWRAEGALTPAAIADRLRWQLDGWLRPEASGLCPSPGGTGGGQPERSDARSRRQAQGSEASGLCPSPGGTGGGQPERSDARSRRQAQGSALRRPTAGISRLWLAPDEVVPAGGRQLGFWGSDAAVADRASRAVARVQGLLGTGSVAVPEWRGSRDPATQVALVEAEAIDLSVDRPGAGRDRVTNPWPGRLPTPAPARVHAEPVPAEVVDADGRPVGVSGRGELSAPPARLSVAGGPWQEVVAWAGPWPVEERWWDPVGARRQARLQVVPAAGPARLAVLEAGRWHVTATYD